MRHRLLLPLLLLVSLQLSRCQLTVSVTKSKVELQESDRSFGQQLVIAPGTSAAITCTVKSSSDLTNPKVVWKRVAENAELDGRFETREELSDSKRTFTSELSVKRLVAEDIANYSCNVSAGGLQASGVGGFRSLPLPKLQVLMQVDGKDKLVEKADLSVWVGEDVRIECDIGGNPRGNAVWSRENGEPVAAVNNSFTIRGLSYERDRGFVACKSNNSLGENSAKLFLRVKSPTAFVLPLIILIVEIVIVAVIVIVYELYMRWKRQQEQAKAD